jgi:hypothetical protein
MTVSSTVSRVVHTANGSSVFFSSAPIQGLTAGNVVVTLTDTNGVTTTQALGTDYTLSPSGVTFTTAPAAGTIVTIRRVVALLQPDQFETNSPFPAKITENRLDQIVFGLQQAADDLGRTVQLHPSDAVSGALPPAAVRANRYLAFGPNGELTFLVPQPVGPNASEAYWWGGTAGGTANALTLSIGGAPGSYAAGQRYAFVVAANNTGAATLAVNGLDVRSLRRPDGTTLAANDLVAGNLVAVTYDGTNFRLAWSSTLNTDLTIAKTDPALILNKTASGQVARVFGRTNGTNRWAIELGDTTAEGGGNAGSNLVVRRYDNSGAVLGAPVIINRASGEVTLEAPLTLPASNPTGPNHATRKAYVDSAIAGLPPQSVSVAAQADITSAVAQVDLALPSGFAMFILVVGDLRPSAQAALNLRTSNDGTTFQSGASDYTFGGTSQSFIGLTGNIAATDAGPAVGQWTIFPGAATTPRFLVYGRAAYSDGTTVQEAWGYGTRNAAGRQQAIRLYMSTGNINRATIRLIGVT